jgi:hypothetical protein
MNVTMENVNSTQLKRIGLDKEHGYLYIEFQSGFTYRYMDVSEEEYEELKNAESIGRKFNELIRGKKTYLKL